MSERRAYQGPFCEVKGENNTIIPIYRVRNGDYTEYRVAWKAEGKRRMKSFADLNDAKKHAGGLTSQIDSGDVKALALTTDEHLVFRRAVEAVRPFQIPLDIAALEYASARKRLGAHTVTEAIEFFLKSHHQIQPRRVDQVVSDLLAEKRKPKKPTQKPASERYLSDLESRLGKFEDSFHCDIGDVHPKQVEDWLNGLNVSGRTYFNYARTILTLFNFAKAKRHYQADRNPFEGFEDVLEFEDESEIEIFTPAEMKHFLGRARSELIPFLVLGAFAGVRSAEIGRLEWSDITATHVKLHRGKTKTRQRRLIEIQPNLKKWLEVYRKESGKVCPIGNIPNAIQDLCADAKAKWKHNALRHSFISYRFAQTDNENLVASEAGNSANMIHRHYRELVTKTDAQAWFSIEP